MRHASLVIDPARRIAPVENRLFDSLNTSMGDSPGLGLRVDEAAIAATTASGWLSSVDVLRGPPVRPEHAGRRLVPQPTASGGRTERPTEAN